MAILKNSQMPHAKWELLLIMYVNQKIWTHIKNLVLNKHNPKIHHHWTKSWQLHPPPISFLSHQVITFLEGSLPKFFTHSFCSPYKLHGWPIIMFYKSAPSECGLHKQQRSDHKLLSQHISLGPCTTLGSHFHVSKIYLLPSHVLPICFWK
jgi:hypothetical protein